LSVIGIVQNPLGYDFAVRFAPDVRVTEDLVRDTWQPRREASATTTVSEAASSPSDQTPAALRPTGCNAAFLRLSFATKNLAKLSRG
jgi:hypothetical protein